MVIIIKNKNIASSIQHKDTKCYNQKVVLEKKMLKSRSNELYVNLFFYIVEPKVYIVDLFFCTKEFLIKALSRAFI